MAEAQIKSRERVQERGEVFTATLAKFEMNNYVTTEVPVKTF